MILIRKEGDPKSTRVVFFFLLPTLKRKEIIITTKKLIAETAIVFCGMEVFLFQSDWIP